MTDTGQSRRMGAGPVVRNVFGLESPDRGRSLSTELVGEGL